MNRSHTTLAGLLVVQIALILFVRSPFGGGSAAAVSHPLLPMLDALTPAQIELLGNDDRHVNLRKQADGWTLPELGGFPADDTKISDLIETLRGLTVRRPVVSSKRYHSSFKVAEDDNQGRVRLWEDPAGDPAVELVMGSSANYRSTHVRLEGDNKVYEVRDFASYDVRADPEAWIEKDLVDVPESQLVGLTLANANGTFELRREDGEWRAVGSDSALDADAVAALARAAGSIQLSKPAGQKDAAELGFAKAAATATLRYRDPADGEAGEVREVVVTVGAKPGDDSSERYVTRSGFEFAGTVWESSIKALLDRKLDDLLGNGDDAEATG